MPLGVSLMSAALIDGSIALLEDYGTMLESLCPGQQPRLHGGNAGRLGKTMFVGRFWSVPGSANCPWH